VDSNLSWHSCPKESMTTPWLDWQSLKCPSPTNVTSCFAIHFTHTQPPSGREINVQQVAEKIELHAAETRVRRERPHFVATDTVVVAPSLDAKESAPALEAQGRGCNEVNVKSLHGFGEGGKNFILHPNLPNWLHLHHHSSKTLQERCKAPAAKSAGGKRTKTGGSDPTFSAPSRPKSFQGRSRPLILCNLH
jgi:hypothetical protein